MKLLYNKILELRNQPAVRAILMLILLTIIAAVLVAVFEAHKNEQFSSFWDSVWWVVVTISTVGYGDKIPVTPVGKVIAGVIMFFGVAFLSIITATISSVFVAHKIKEGKGLQEIKLKDHLLLCGWNAQAESILAALEREEGLNKPVVLINQLSEEEATDIVARFGGLKIKYVRGDFTRENILNRANVQNAGSAIILPDISSTAVKPGDERTILATLSLKTLNPKIKVYAHILDRENLSHLRKARADEVIISDVYTGYLLASYVTSPGVPQFMEQLFSENSSYRIKRRAIPENLLGKTYADLISYYNNEKPGILLGLGQMTEPFNLSDLMSDDYSHLDDYIMRKFQEAGRGSNSDEQVKILINPPKETELNKNDFYIAIESNVK